MQTKPIKWLVIMITMAAISSYTKPVFTSNSRAGLYITSDDFNKDRLTYGFDCRTENGKLKINETFDGSSGYVLIKGQKHSFDKLKTYGYRSCEDKSFRFYGKEAYQIIDTAGFFMYYHYQSIEKVKR